MPAEYVVTTKPSHCLFILFIGAVFLYLGLDLRFFHRIPGAKVGPNNVVWIALSLVGLLCTIGSVRGFFWPRTYLSADARGIALYSGRTAKSWNPETRSWDTTRRAGDTQLIPWDQIVDIGQTLMITERRTPGPKANLLGGKSSLGMGRIRETKAKALKVLCDRSIRLEGFDIFRISLAWNGLNESDLKQMTKADRDKLGLEDLNSGFVFHHRYLKGGLQNAIAILNRLKQQQLDSKAT